MGEKTAPEKGKGPGRSSLPPFAQRAWCLSQLQPVKTRWVSLYMFGVSFDFILFFCIRGKMFLSKEFVDLFKLKLW